MVFEPLAMNLREVNIYILFIMLHIDLLYTVIHS